jgi:hypothetical protein
MAATAASKWADFGLAKIIGTQPSAVAIPPSGSQGKTNGDRPIALREAAARVYQAIFDHSVGEHEPIPPSHCPSVILELRPVAVYTDRANIVIALARVADEESGFTGRCFIARLRR